MPCSTSPCAWPGKRLAFLLELHERHGPAALVAALAGLDKVVPVYLMPTHLGYPMGGGESFMHQTCRILSEFGVRCVWVSYLDPVKGWFERDSVTYTPYYLDVQAQPHGCSEEAIQREVDYFGPDLIHAQGGTNDAAMAIADTSRIHAMIGYHFWSGLVTLGESGNRHIMDNLAGHALTPPPLPPSRTIWKYVASEFMQQVHLALGGKEKLNVIHAVSDRAQYHAPCGTRTRFVLQINVCPLKGGEIFLACVQALGDKVPFLGIKSEIDGSGFFDILDAEVAQHPLSQLKSYGNVRDFYRQARMVIVPTLVDETFCRVAFEAAMNGIPVVSTANGFLPQMLGESGIFRGEDAAEWIATIDQLYHNPERLAHISAAQKAHLEANFGSDFRSFITL
ncbi:glycosyltransferase [Massilia sp. H-1]|nr:glycosyltransferase [Massilia sp. H-1]